MGAEGERSSDAAEGRAQRAPSLAVALRALATRSVGGPGGFALVFAAEPGEAGAEAALRLRAAAGLASPDAARSAARALYGELRASLESGQARAPEVPEGLGEGIRSLLIHPARVGERAVGAVAVGSPAPLSPERRECAALSSELLAAEIEIAQLRGEAEGRRADAHDVASRADEKSEEILKLSEALFAQDIEILRNNEKLGKIEKLKNDFIEKMSRELRTPLNSIIEAIISVLTGEDDALSEGAKATLRSALDDGTAFLRTLQNILDLWRIKQRELPIEIQDVNFGEVVEEAVFSVQDALGEKPLVLEQRLQQPFPKIRTDLTKVNQILFLLLDNAVKFTPRGQIEIAARVEDDKLFCEVRDTGIGICADDQQFIFDEFFQVDDAASEKSRGAGLGLALVRDLVVLLEGSLAVSSEVGRGTSVSLEIPVQRSS